MTTPVSADAHRDIAISESSSLRLSDSASVEFSRTKAMESENLLPKSLRDSEVSHSAAQSSSSANGGSSYLASEDSTTLSNERLTSEELPDVSEQDKVGRVQAEKISRSEKSEKNNGISDRDPEKPAGDDDKSDEDESDDLSEKLDERVKRASKRLNQYTKYVQLMEDRVSHLEEKFRKLESRKKPSSSPAEKLKSSTVPELRYVKWNEFKHRYATGKEVYAIEVLTGGARYWYQLRMDERMRKLKASGNQATAGDINDSSKAGFETHDELPERIRINSPAVVAILSDIALETWSMKSIVLLTPYKLLVQYDSEIREFFAKLESKFSSFPDPHTVHNEKLGKGTMEDAEKMTDSSQGIDDPTGNKSMPTNMSDQEAPDDLVGNRKAFEDLRCLIKFMDRHLTPIIKQFRECTREYVHFHELWYLFKAGDIIYSPKKWENMGSNTERAPPDSASPDSASQERRPERYQTMFRVYSRLGGRPILSSQNATKNQPPLKERVRQFILLCYHMDYVGKNFLPINHTFFIQPFEGKRKITSLEAYPLAYAENHAAIKDKSIARGVKFKRILNIKHMLYTGPTYISDPGGWRDDTYPKAVEQIDSRVIIDFDEAINHTPVFVYENKSSLMTRATVEDEGIEFKEDYPTVVWGDYDEKEVHSHSDDMIFNDSIVEIRFASNFLSADPYLKSFATDSEDSNNTYEPLRDEDVMLLTSRVVAYVLRDRKFALLNVENFYSSNPNPDGFTDLKLPSGHKEMVQALVRSHSMKRVTNASINSNIDHDVVTGKGRGLIILLHGVPGVGKTSTAECVAESTGKPLFPITCGDLGLTPREVEESLKGIFQLAQLWDCVLLLDEADVFLSQRTKTDLTRNALVSVFLRVLEYYQGILFLTTNRVGAFDEAFKSRIHISLYYPELARPQSLKIWEMNLERARKIDLERTRTQTMPGLIIDEEDIKSYAEIHWIENHNGVGRWNGRQIRNAFQTASALALYEAHMKNAKRLRENPDAEVIPPQLMRKHFEKVAKATSQFGEYMKDTVGKDDAEASLLRGDRNDHFRLRARSARQPDNPQVYSQPYTPPDVQQHYSRTPTPNYPPIRHRQAAPPSGTMRSEPFPASEPFVDQTGYAEYHSRTGGLSSFDSNVDEEIEYD